MPAVDASNQPCPEPGSSGSVESEVEDRLPEFANVPKKVLSTSATAPRMQENALTPLLTIDQASSIRP